MTFWLKPFLSALLALLIAAVLSVGSANARSAGYLPQGKGTTATNPAHDLSNSYVEVGLPTAGDGAGYAYLDTLLSSDRLTVEEMQLLQHHYYDQQVQLGPLGQLLVNYLTSAIIPGSGIVAAMQKVAVSGLLEGVITGDLDVNALLKDIVFAGVSNWATGAIDLNALGIEGLSGDSYLGMGEQFSEANLAEGLLDTAITSGLSSVAYGTDFTETFLNNYASFAVMAATADLQTGIGDWAFRTDQVGSFAHYGRHALTGCVAGSLVGGDCVSAAVGAVAGEGYGLVTGDTNSNTAYLVAGLAAAITSGGDTTATLTAANLGQSAFENNYLTHEQIKAFEQAIEECGSLDPDCIAEVQDRYQGLSQANREEMFACTTLLCWQTHAAEIQRARSAMLDLYQRGYGTDQQFDPLWAGQSDFVFAEQSQSGYSMLASPGGVEAFGAWGAEYCSGAIDEACRVAYAQSETYATVVALGQIGIGFVPVVGDVQGVLDCYNQPSLSACASAAAGIILPAAGDAARLILRHGDETIEIISDGGGSYRIVDQAAPKGGGSGRFSGVQAQNADEVQFLRNAEATFGESTIWTGVTRHRGELVVQRSDIELSSQNVTRMRNGQAPFVRNVNGDWEPLQLHHVGRETGQMIEVTRSQNSYNHTTGGPLHIPGPGGPIRQPNYSQSYWQERYQGFVNSGQIAE